MWGEQEKACKCGESKAGMLGGQAGMCAPVVEETHDNAKEHLRHTQNHSHFHFVRIAERKLVLSHLPDLPPSTPLSKASGVCVGADILDRRQWGRRS